MIVSCSVSLDEGRWVEKREKGGKAPRRRGIFWDRGRKETANMMRHVWHDCILEMKT